MIELLSLPGGRPAYRVKSSAERLEGIRAVLLTLMLVVAAIGVPMQFVGVASASDAATIDADPNTVSSTSTHTVRAEVEDEDEGQSLQDIDVDYNSAQIPASVENVDESDVSKVGIDNNGDGAIDIDLSGTITNIEYNNDFHTITFIFDESYELNQSDAVVIAYQDVTNPDEPGEYQTQVSINHDKTDHPAKATLNIVEDDSTPETTIDSASVDPSTVAPGETVSNQIVQFSVSNVSGDGVSDTHYVTFPDALAGRLSPNSATVVSGPASIVSSIELVDGPDGDGEMDTLTFATNDDSGSVSDLVLEVDTTVEYPDASSGTQYGIDIRVDDSDSTDAFSDDAAVVTVEDNTPPEISSFSLTNPSDTTLQVSFDSNESLSDIQVEISGDTNHALNEEDFTSTYDSGTYTYTATYDPGATGSYTATLEVAADDAGNDGADGDDEETDSVTIEDGSTTTTDSTDDGSTSSDDSTSTTSTDTASSSDDTSTSSTDDGSTSTDDGSTSSGDGTATPSDGTSTPDGDTSTETATTTAPTTTDPGVNQLVIGFGTAEAPAPSSVDDGAGSSGPLPVLLAILLLLLLSAVAVRKREG
ncbi:hypothetical protein [Haloparvum sp. AD34]